MKIDHCYLGDCRDVIETLPDWSVDSVVTDPPYHLTNKGGGPHGKGVDNPFSRSRAGAKSTGFMNKKWDGGDIAFDPATWRAVFRVMKPGAYLIAFGGTRTYHRLACAIEDAGFEIRDQIGWLYGSGFPKGTDKAKIPDAWKGFNTALKPAWEPMVLARKPLIGTLADNLEIHACGALNINGCRVSIDPQADASQLRTMDVSQHDGADGWGMNTLGPRPGSSVLTTAGRWPANLIHDGSDEVVALFPSEAGAAAPVYRRNADKFCTAFGAFAGNTDEAGSTFHSDAGSAARFFYCAKASRADRTEGMEDPGPQFKHGSTLRDAERIDAGSVGNNHPTVKPTDLMRYLCRLVTPPGGTVLDPFMGSGSTGKAAILEGFQFIGIEREAEYIEIARVRIAAARRQHEDAHRQADLGLEVA